MKTFQISQVGAGEKLLSGLKYAGLTFLVAYLINLDPKNFFLAFSLQSQIEALIIAVNSCWAAFIAGSLPFLGLLLHPTKK